MNSTYQIYDFVKDINYHVDNKIPIDLKNKSEIFKNYLFKLKHYHFTNKIKRNHPLFKQDYFLYTLYGQVFVAKRFKNNPNSPLKFDSVEILKGLKIIRRLKLEKIFKK